MSTDVTTLPPTPLTLLAAAIDRGVDPDRLGKLMDLAERWQTLMGVQAFNRAMNAAQAEMGSVFKSGRNPDTKSPFAPLEDIQEICSPVFTRHGFSLSFTEGDPLPNGMMPLILTVSHTDGHSREYRGNYPADGVGPKGGRTMNPVQGVVSSHTYAMRDLTRMAGNLRITGTDTDGNAAASLDTLIAAEVEEIETLLSETKADRARFLAWAKVADIWDILRRDFLKVKTILQSKKAKQS